MSLAWTIRLSDRARKDLAKLDASAAKRIDRFMENRVLALLDPRLIGDPLVGNLQGYWRYRIGDYRIICELQDRELLIMVIAIGHRKEIYH